MVGGRLPQKRVTIEVYGPKSMLREPVKQRVNFNLTFRDFLKEIVDRKKLVGCKVTKAKGTWSNAVCLDSIIKDFIQSKFTKKMDCYRIRLMKLKKKRGPGSSQGSPDRNQVVYTIEDDDDVSLMGSPRVEAAPLATVAPDVSDAGDDGGEDVDDQQVEEIPVEPPHVEAAPLETSDVGDEVVDDEQPGSSRSFFEEIGRERSSMPPPPPPSSLLLGNNFPIKSESWDTADIKSDFHDAESTIGFLRDNGVAIDNLKAQVQERMEDFKNPFLLLLKEELVELRNSGGPQWQSLVGKAPRCVHLLGELFNID